IYATSLACQRNNSTYNHHLWLWHSPRAIDQRVTGKEEDRGVDSADTARKSARKVSLPKYLHFCMTVYDQKASRTMHCRVHVPRHRVMRYPLSCPPFAENCPRQRKRARASPESDIQRHSYIVG
ncbi:hypothetical protein V1527DRAFT_416462, partial [Lipomyces starkeyi]